MDNLDKVIESLEICTKQLGKCSDCHYRTTDKPLLICRELATDILDLMKKQKEEIAQLKIAFLTLPNWNPVVVRCKDCKHAHLTYDGDCKYCDNIKDDDGFPIERYHPGDWFCADGERKDSE